MDSECDLDIVIPQVYYRAPFNQTHHSFQFNIKIYKNGNINISERCMLNGSFSWRPLEVTLITNDNIPFPPYVISMLKDLFMNTSGGTTFDVIAYRKIFESIKILQEELVKVHKSSDPIGPWSKGVSNVQLNKIPELEKIVSQKDKKISILEKQVEHIRKEVATGEKTIGGLLYAAKLCADEKTCSIAQSKRIDELERILAHKDKKIRALEKDPSYAELDIRAKEGAKKHAEAKAKLQKIYDERPMINLMDG